MEIRSSGGGDGGVGFVVNWFSINANQIFDNMALVSVGRVHVRMRSLEVAKNGNKLQNSRSGSSNRNTINGSDGVHGQNSGLGSSGSGCGSGCRCSISIAVGSSSFGTLGGFGSSVGRAKHVTVGFGEDSVDQQVRSRLSNHELIEEFPAVISNTESVSNVGVDDIASTRFDGKGSSFHSIVVNPVNMNGFSVGVDDSDECSLFPEVRGEARARWIFRWSANRDQNFIAYINKCKGRIRGFASDKACSFSVSEKDADFVEAGVSGSSNQQGLNLVLGHFSFASIIFLHDTLQLVLSSNVVTLGNFLSISITLHPDRSGQGLVDVVITKVQRSKLEPGGGVSRFKFEVVGKFVD